MIKIIPINEPHVLAFEVSGKLTEEDYAIFTPMIDRLIEKEKRISLLVQFNDFEGLSAKAAWEDIKLAYNHNDDFLRIAIVGNSFKEKMMATFGDLFMEADVKHFEEESKAMTWLKEVQNLAEQDEYIGYRHVLVATDFSGFSQAALKKGCELAKPFSAKLSVIHVADLTSAALSPALGEMAVPFLADNPELEKKLLDKLSKDLNKEVKALDIPADSVEATVISGHPIDALLDYAMSHNVDLIVMGSHGRRGLARLLGSSTNGVINHAPCDVLVVV